MESEAFERAAWVAGEKLGLLIHGEKRCYTPLAVDQESSRRRLLICPHGGGPGSAWAASAKVGDECHFVGPRPSLDLSQISGPAVLFGDETSFAVASALRTHLGKTALSSLIFEVTCIQSAAEVLAAVGIADAVMIERGASNNHLIKTAECVRLALNQPVSEQLVLTGSALSIQTLRGMLNSREIALSKNKVKAYWSPGRSGLN